MTWAEITASGIVLALNFSLGYLFGRWAVKKMNGDEFLVSPFKKALKASKEIVSPPRKGGPVKVNLPVKIADEKEKKVEEEISKLL